MSKAGEYCGLCGISGFKGNSVALVTDGLLALQHRGQEAAGVLAYSNGKILGKWIFHDPITHS